MSVTHIGDLALDSIIDHLIGDRLDLKSGKALTVLNFGLEQMRRRLRACSVTPDEIASAVRHAQQQFDRGRRVAESPIERMTLAALLTSDWSLASEWADGAGALPVTGYQDDAYPSEELAIIPQFSFQCYRLDFAILVHRRADWKLWALECDGREFHLDYERDSERDYFFSSLDVETYRLSGDVIYRDVHAALLPLIQKITAWREARR